MEKMIEEMPDAGTAKRFENREMQNVNQEMNRADLEMHFEMKK